MKIFNHKKGFLAYRAILGTQRSPLQLGFVPTMGYLHKGHLNLVRASVRENTHTIVSIFVNPTQFAPHEDFTTYPRNVKRDLELLSEAGATAVWLPREQDIYPTGRTIQIEQTVLTKLYCGVTRPHFFSGGMTVIAKFLNLIQPHQVYFGKKDFQQLVLFKTMIRELAFPVKVRAIATARERNGLALSSRNAYLTPTEQETAAYFYKTLKLVRKKFREKQEISPHSMISAEELCALFSQEIKSVPAFKIDYVAVADKQTLLPSKNVFRGKNIMLAALFFLEDKTGKPIVRLIDNIEL